MIFCFANDNSPSDVRKSVLRWFWSWAIQKFALRSSPMRFQMSHGESPSLSCAHVADSPSLCLTREVNRPHASDSRQVARIPLIRLRCLSPAR